MRPSKQSSSDIIKRRLAEYIEFACDSSERSPARLQRFVRNLNRNLTPEQRRQLHREIMKPQTISIIRQRISDSPIIASILSR